MSQAAGSQTLTSDIDVVLFLNKLKTKAISNLFNSH